MAAAPPTRSGPSTPVQPLPAPPPPISLPPVLERCERWAQLAGRPVHRGMGLAPAPIPGAPPIAFPVLAVQQGAIPVLIRALSDQESMVEIFVNIPIPAEVRQRLSQAEPQLRLRVLLTLRRELLLSGRTGFGIVPPTATSAEQVEVITLNQQVSVATGAGAEVTRLLDGLLEVASAAMRAASVLAPVASGSPGTGGTSPPPSSDAEHGPGRMFG